MMHRARPIMTLSILCTLAGCTSRQTPPWAYVHFVDQVRALTYLGYVCAEERQFISEGKKIDYIEPIRFGPDCYRYDPQRVFRGVWTYEFEGSSFLEGASIAPTGEAFPANSAWLYGKLPPVDTERMETPPYPVVAYQLVFLGRRTSVKGAYGHMGAYRHEVIVDKMISAHRIPTR